MMKVGGKAIEVCSVSYTAGRDVVLDGVSFVVNRGELITIIGPNGAGKTTLIRIMMGLVRASSGSVVRSPGLRIGYVPQDFALNSYLPIVVRSFLNTTLVCNKSNFDDVVRLADIGNLLDLSVDRLSGGELRRVMIAKALMVGRDVLIMDEPASYFDLKQRDNFYNLLRSINKEVGCTIVLVSHDLFMIMRHTDRVLCISRSVCYLGCPKQMVGEPGLVKLFGEDFRNIAIHGHHHR